MNFSWSNREKIDNLYIHDSEFIGYTYSYDTHQILLTCENYFLKKVFYFTFNNVVYHNMQSCSFWGPGNSILCVYLGDKSLHDIFLPIARGAQNDPNPCWEFEKYIHIVFEINSGDLLNIFCENVDFQEGPVSPEKLSLFEGTSTP